MKQKPFEADDCSPLIEAVKRGEVELVSRARGQYPGTRLKAGHLPGLRTIGYWDAVGVQGWGLPMHRNEGIEICYLLSGETSFATDSREWTLRPGDITITRPWQRHRLGNPKIRACKLFWFILDVENGCGRQAWDFPDWIGPDAGSRRDLLRAFRKNQSCHLRDDGHALREFMRSTCHQLKEDRMFSTARIASVINYLVVSVAEQLSGSIHSESHDPQGFDRTVREFFLGLEASIEKAAEPWSVSQMAHACRVGVTYLTSSCKQIFNTTPSEQLNRIRLHHAATLLKEGAAHPVTTIAFEVGYNTSQYFATRFKAHFGMSPQEFRAQGEA